MLVDAAPLVVTGRAMASPVRITLGAPGDDPVAAARAAAALEVFADVEAQCSRFDPASDLHRANDAPGRWHRVGTRCAAAVEAAWLAYSATAGRFDPRVLADLVALGYDRWPPAERTSAAPARRRAMPWGPSFDPEASKVHLGGSPVDLGGIGKGLALRWAAEALDGLPHLVEAGGDVTCLGPAPDGGPWRLGVEDPAGGEGPVAVLELDGGACATSSVRRRSWQVGTRAVHHLIDPTTGEPGGAGLSSVTVVAGDPAWAEVWSKVLFLAGAEGVAAAADRTGVEALWVHEDGTLGWNPPLAPRLRWRR